MKNGKTNKEMLSASYAKELKPMIDYCIITRGARADICRRLNEFLPEPLPMIQVSNWLNPKPENRSQPSYAMGRLLLKVWEQMQRE